MLYIKDDKIVSSKQRVLFVNNKQIINPKEQDFLDNGFVEYIAPEVEEINDEEFNNE